MPASAAAHQRGGGRQRQRGVPGGAFEEPAGGIAIDEHDPHRLAHHDHMVGAVIAGDFVAAGEARGDHVRAGRGETVAGFDRLRLAGNEQAERLAGDWLGRRLLSAIRRAVTGWLPVLTISVRSRQGRSVPVSSRAVVSEAMPALRSVGGWGKVRSSSRGLAGRVFQASSSDCQAPASSKRQPWRWRVG